MEDDSLPKAAGVMLTDLFKAMPACNAVRKYLQRACELSEAIPSAARKETSSFSQCAAAHARANNHEAVCALSFLRRDG